MRHNTIFVFLFGLTLFASASITEPVHGQEAPGVIAQANAPGWITVSWEHTGQDVYYFLIQRQYAPYTDSSIVNIAQSNNRTDSVTDKNLTADTIYKYRACAVYAYSRTCSDWVSVRTLSPPPPSSSGSSGSTSPPPAMPSLRTPDLTATPTSARVIVLNWGEDQVRYLKNVQLLREGQVVYDAKITGYTPEYIDPLPRANTKYTYKVCFTSLADETKCSAEITASGKPIAPTAPADVTISQRKSRGRASDLTARIKTLITARWRVTDIPGQFITLEREDRVQIDRLRVGAAWVEIERLSAEPNPSDPTELTVDVTPEDPELLTNRGDSYRVCSIVPALGAAGKVCSSAVSPGTASSTTASATPEPIRAQGRVRLPAGTPPSPPRPICNLAREARERNSPAAPGLEQKCRAELAPKGEAIANQDPVVAEARNAEADASYRQGFDIATAIFGDPALGAQGNTQTGPGSLGIRNSLNAAGQRGFDDSVKLHLSRKY